eukprot:754872-Hanusia_phi.AAC.1
MGRKLKKSVAAAPDAPAPDAAPALAPSTDPSPVCELRAKMSGVAEEESQRGRKASQRMGRV